MKQFIKKYGGMTALLALWLGLSLWAWVKPADAISLSERRALAQFPEAVSDFADDFSAYATDQFPLREPFRQLKAWVSTQLFRQSDNNGIYIADGSAAEMLYPLDENSLDYAAARFTDLYQTYFQDANQILFAIVPDKNYYLAQSSGHLALDYDALFAAMESSLPWAEFVDLTDCLTVDSYYRTDTHWRQEALLPTAQRLGEALGVSLLDSFTQETLDRDFYGVYYGQAALPLEPDALSYLTWEGWEDCAVYSYDTGETTQIYDFGKLDSNDRYDFFLSGGMALQTITNPHADTDRELIVFRDSFGSSLIPLLVQSYRKITLIDTRYVSPSQLGNYVNFQGQDVLLLYSTLLLNSSSALRK